jgi:hypothetical protein
VVLSFLPYTSGLEAYYCCTVSFRFQEEAVLSETKMTDLCCRFGLDLSNVSIPEIIHEMIEICRENSVSAVTFYNGGQAHTSTVA